MNASELDRRTVDVVDAMLGRRMHRQFEDRPVPFDLLRTLAWGAVRAQQARSGVRNLVLVDDPGLMATARQVLPGFVNNAPAMIVHCTDVRRAEEAAGRRAVELITRLDAGAACAHLALLAQAYGLGTCTITSWSEAVVSELIGLPEHIRPDVTVAIGYVPDEAPPPARGFRTALHHGSFGATVEPVRP